MEKTQQLVAGIEGFDSSKLRHTETHEKNPLPDKDGEHIITQYSSIIIKVITFCMTAWAKRSLARIILKGVMIALCCMNNSIICAMAKNSNSYSYSYLFCVLTFFFSSIFYYRF